MKQATNKLAASLFTLIGMAPLLFILVTGIKQQEIRHIMREELENKMLQTLTLSVSDVHWMRDGKEILINGRMFDVKSFRADSDGKIHFTGLYDDDETALFNKIKENQQSGKNDGAKLLTELFRLLQSTCNNTTTEIYIPVLHHQYFPGLEPSPESCFLAILSPPPQA